MEREKVLQKLQEIVGKKSVLWRDVDLAVYEYDAGLGRGKPGFVGNIFYSGLRTFHLIDEKTNLIERRIYYLKKILQALNIQNANVCGNVCLIFPVVFFNIPLTATVYYLPLLLISFSLSIH